MFTDRMETEKLDDGQAFTKAAAAGSRKEVLPAGQGAQRRRARPGPGAKTPERTRPITRWVAQPLNDGGFQSPLGRVG